MKPSKAQSVANDNASNAHLVDTANTAAVRALIRETIATMDAADEAPGSLPVVLHPPKPVDSVPPTARQGHAQSEVLRIASRRSDVPSEGPSHVLTAMPLIVSSAPDAKATPVGPDRAMPEVRNAKAALAEPEPETAKARPKARAGLIAAMVCILACGGLALTQVESIGVRVGIPLAKAARGEVEQDAKDEIDAPKAKRELVTAAPTSRLVDRDVSSLLRRASDAMRAGATSDATSLLLQATEVNPMSAEAWSDLGQIASNAGKREDAKTNFARALNADAEFLPAALGMADVLWAGGEREDAGKAYGRLVDQFPASMLPPRVLERSTK